MVMYEVQGLAARVGRPLSENVGQGQCRMMRDGRFKARDERRCCYYLFGRTRG